MRFRRGSRVEVLTKKKVPSGVWRCAEIVADNRDGYTVRYIRGNGAAKDGVHSVSAEAIRPCPPQVSGFKAWDVDDVVEVFDDGFWRVSMIDEVLADYYYQVHVIGCLYEFQVEESSIRPRQEWINNKWFLIDNDYSGIGNDLLSKWRKRIRMQEGVFTMVRKMSTLLTRPSANYQATETAVPRKLGRKRKTVDKGANLAFICGQSNADSPEIANKQTSVNKRPKIDAVRGQ